MHNEPSHHEYSEYEDEHHPENEKWMSLAGHLGEFRSRLLRSLLVVLGLFCVAIPFAPQILEWSQFPLIHSLGTNPLDLHFTGPFDVFMVSIKVCVLVAVFFACPYWIWQIWAFVSPALYEKERKMVVPFAIASIVLFWVGTSFCFFYVLPMGMKFLIQYGAQVATPIITIKDYLSILIPTVLGFGIVFEAPVLIVLLGSLGLFRAETLAKYRSIIVVCIFILAALLTPPEPLTQIAMAVPLYLMFEASIWILYVIQGRKSA
jgi:sec-independent protein translocase protein TatC